MKEFDWTAYAGRHAGAARDDVSLGIGDDAALIRPPPGHELVVSTDTLNVGVHFREQDDPESLGHKSLAVSLSDIAAMGASPAWALFNLSLPRSNAAWLRRLVQGFQALLHDEGVQLVGGDTTRGSLSLSWTVVGLVETGKSLTRQGACAGDSVVVSGQPGLAAEGLRLALSGEPLSRSLEQALHRPQPRLALGQGLVGLASACIDVSDGLVADLGHLCAASGVGAVVDAHRLPLSDILATLPEPARWHRVLAGGDDYELCFTVPPEALPAVNRLSLSARLPLTVIGRVVPGSGVRCVDASGQALEMDLTGYQHFAGNDLAP